MDSALAWIGWIAQWIGQFIPRWVIVDTTHGAVKWIKGSRVVALGPGLHWYWPVTTNFNTYPTARQATDLRTQTLETEDGLTIVVGGIIVYEINDVEAILAHTYDPEQTIKDISLSAIHRVLVRKSYPAIKAEVRSGSLERDLKTEVKRELGRYGVKVIKVAITDLAKTRVYKLIQSTSQEGL
jgi:regulator of protease activity HflC (stomatin/prohibitin superfamily)